MTPILLLLIFIFAKLKVEAQIEKRIEEYYNHPTFKYFQETWYKLRPSYENAIATTLKETFGSLAGTMNVYIKRVINPQNLLEGYYFTDNVVNVILQNLYLRELPRLYSPDVSFSLHHNVIRVESPVSTVFVDADYVVFRNRSDIVLSGSAQKEDDPSPFSFQQVQTSGVLTISGEDCHLIGQAVITLSGLSVHLGHSTFRLKMCQFSIEIYRPSLPSPPVLAPYFTPEQTHNLQTVLSTALNEEMRSILKGILYSQINTTAMFRTNMPKCRRKQKHIFEDTADYMARIIRQMNEDVLKKNGGIVSIADTSLTWDMSLLTEDEQKQSTLTLSGITVSGLDRLYHSRSGGPIVTAQHEIADELRFEKLQVRGKLIFSNDTMKRDPLRYDFSVELKDVAVDVKIKLGIKSGQTGRQELFGLQYIDGAQSNAETNTNKDGAGSSDDANSDDEDVGPDDPKIETIDDKPKARSNAGQRSVLEFKVTGWRSLEFTSNDYNVYMATNVPSYAFITGYIVSELPNTISKNLQGHFESAVQTADKESDKLKYYNDKKKMKGTNQFKKLKEKWHKKGLKPRHEKKSKNKNSLTE